eukprot:scaffold681560_cov43-Prasinocladus_malaysianus.AAC.1
MAQQDMKVLRVLTVDDEPPSLANVSVTPACDGANVSLSPSEAGTLAYLLVDCDKDLLGAVTSDDVFAGQVDGVTVLENGTMPMLKQEALTIAFQ